MKRPAGGWCGRTRTRAVADSEVADLPDESAYPGKCGVSVKRCHTADRAEFRRRLLSGHVFQDFLNNVRTGDIGNDAQPTAAVRTDRQIDREHPLESFHPTHRRGRRSRIVLMISTQHLHPSVSSRAPSAGSSRRVRHHGTTMLGVRCQDAVVSHQVAAWSRYQRRQSGQELDRLEHKMGGTVPVWGVHRVHPCTRPLRGSLRRCKSALLPICQLIHG